MNKHSYLIVAHNNFEQLKLLLTLIDDERNDIFLFVDKKSSAQFHKENLKVIRSHLHINSPFQISWGGYSQCRATLFLLREALKQGEYTYFHLLSGVDLPLHGQDYIHDFFEKYDGYEFLAYVGKELYEKNRPEERLKYYYLFQDAGIRNPLLKKIVTKIGNDVFVRIQKVFGVNRLTKLGKIQIGYGTNWFSITSAFAKYILREENKIERIYRNSLCCDEIFIHTLALNSEFKDRIFVMEGLHDKKEDRQGSLRYINWWDGNPKVWTMEDKDELLEARDRGYLFSRKFDERKDKEIIAYISEMVKNEREYVITDRL